MLARDAGEDRPIGGENEAEPRQSDLRLQGALAKSRSPVGRRRQGERGMYRIERVKATFSLVFHTGYEKQQRNVRQSAAAESQRRGERAV